MTGSSILGTITSMYCYILVSNLARDNWSASAGLALLRSLRAVWDLNGAMDSHSELCVLVKSRGAG